MSGLRLACSNLAWTPDRLGVALGVLQREGFTGVEVAPTQQWGDWGHATRANAADLKRQLAAHGFEVPALQSILYKRADLKLFDRLCWPDLVLHIEHVAQLAEALGARVLVLGAPRQRLIDRAALASAQDIAADILMVLAKVCHEHGARLCIEPNARRYGCDFIWTTDQALELIDRVAHPGFGLHLDAAAMYLEGEDLVQVIERLPVQAIEHFHVSEPDLGGLSRAVVPHFAALNALSAQGYSRWVSLESTDVADFEGSVRRLGTWARSYRHAA